VQTPPPQGEGGGSSPEASPHRGSPGGDASPAIRPPLSLACDGCAMDAVISRQCRLDCAGDKRYGAVLRHCLRCPLLRQGNL
jgi:hypothetical protein